MKALLLIFGAIFMLRADAYILLTANMEDVHSLAQQLAASPVVEHVKKIWRRASIQFQKELKHQNSRRQAGQTVEQDNEGDTETERRTRRVIRDLVALGKEAGYLDPIQQLLQKIEDN